MLTFLDKILTFALTLGFLVFFHELGHFAVAKLFKVPVYEFAFGLPFGKKFLLFKRGGTDYTMRPVPLGGFVAFADPEADPEVQLVQMEEYHSKPIWQRFLVIAAGPAASLLLGFLLFVALGVVVGVPNEKSHPVLNQVVAGRPAEKAGLKVGDEILTVDGQPKTVEGLIAAISASPGTPMTFVVKRKAVSEPVTVAVTPTEEVSAGKVVGRIGIGPDYLSRRPMNGLGEALAYGSDQTLDKLQRFKEIFSSFRQVKDNIGGPVGIAGAVSQATDMGFWAKLLLAGSLSVSLFVFNCFVPIPALDCGQMVLLLVEAIRRRRLSNEQQSRVMIASWAVLLTFFVVVTFNDIRKLIPGQH